jgi:hypothetical protein
VSVVLYTYLYSPSPIFRFSRFGRISVELCDPR